MLLSSAFPRMIICKQSFENSSRSLAFFAVKKKSNRKARKDNRKVRGEYV